jgi:hypothetical protein
VVFFLLFVGCGVRDVSCGAEMCDVVCGGDVVCVEILRQISGGEMCCVGLRRGIPLV